MAKWTEPGSVIYTATPSGYWPNGIERTIDCPGWPEDPTTDPEDPNLADFNVLGVLPIVVVEDPPNTFTVSAILDTGSDNYLEITEIGIKVGPVPYRWLSGETTYTVLPADHGYIVEFAPTGFVGVHLISSSSYVTLQETTVVCTSEFTLTWAAGVTVNSSAGPGSLTIRALPDGIVLKQKGLNNWLALGDAYTPA